MNDRDRKTLNSRTPRCDVQSRALAIWPGLDRRKLARTCGDPFRVARLVERRTALPLDAILGMLGVAALK